LSSCVYKGLAWNGPTRTCEKIWEHIQVLNLVNTKKNKLVSTHLGIK